VILDLHRFLAPGDNCVDFWKDAAARYKNNPAVLFDIFNEPHDISWEVWRNGGTVEASGKPPFHSPGMQGLVDAVRGTGAKNIIVAGGLAYAYDLTGILKGYALDDKGGNGIMYATHFYNWHKGWAEHFLAVAEKYPVLVGETGADTKKMNFIPASQQEDPYTWVPDALGFIQKYRLNWTAFSLHTGATPVLISDWNYTPTPFWGVFVKEALSGKQFEMKSMR
ncbi:MAG TPA: cellulase family glycosylhydrolase, partial [Candidatus Methylacidiphilales bacterium]